MADDSEEFKKLLWKRFPDLEQEKVDLLDRYRTRVLEENQRQNLTRITSALDWVERNVVDVMELKESGLIDYPALDLGSGMGVPGFACALLDEKPWVLVESEKKKAAFLTNIKAEFKLEKLMVYAGRAEDCLDMAAVGSIVVRAVGPIDRMYKAIRKCSTWNNLILLKGPRWKEEWDKFHATKLGKELEVELEHEYLIEPSQSGLDTEDMGEAHDIEEIESSGETQVIERKLIRLARAKK